MQWPDVLSAVLSIVSVLAAGVAIFVIRSQAAATKKSSDLISRLRAREARLRYLADHPDAVTEEDIEDLNLSHHGKA